MQLCFGVSPGEVTWECTSDMSNSNCNLFRAVNCIEQKKNEQCHVNKEEDDDEDATQHIVAF